MDPHRVLEDLAGDHSNFIAAFGTLAHAEIKNTVSYIQSSPAHSQIAKTHFGPKITFLPKMTSSNWFFGMLSICKC